MNPQLRNKIVAAITGGGGAIAIATAMLGGHDGLRGGGMCSIATSSAF